MRIPAIVMSSALLVATAPAFAQKRLVTPAPTTSSADIHTATADDGQMHYAPLGVDAPAWSTPALATHLAGGDAQLETQIENRLASVRGVDLSGVQIHAMRGAVTFRGTVADEATRSRILVAANDVDGVVVVRDEMGLRNPADRVFGGGPIDDVQIARAASFAVAHDAGVVGAPLATSSSHGIVTVSGHVVRWNDARRIMQDIRAVPGVRGVRTNLDISENDVVDVNGHRVLRGTMGR